MHFFCCLAASVLVSTGLAAHAESFRFSFGDTSDPFSGSGVLTTGVMEAPGEYLVTGVTGTVQTTVNGPNLIIASLLAPGTFPTLSNGGTFPANDNTLFVNNGIGAFSQDGLSFLLGNGAQINLYNDGIGNNAYLERNTGTTLSEDVPTSITAIAPTPEPSSLLLLGTGLLTATALWTRKPSGPRDHELLSAS